MNRRPDRRAVVAMLFVAILAISDVTGGLLQRTAIDGDEAQQQGSGGLSMADVRDLEDRWAGGGPAILFADDMSDATRQYMEQLQPSPLEGYYGGAVPIDGASPQRWRHDAYRWANADTAGQEDEPWSWNPGFWRFGSDGEDGPSYPGGSLFELVTPVIDLRSVEPLADPDLDDASVSAGFLTDPCNDSGSALNTLACELRGGGGQDRVETGFQDAAGRGDRQVEKTANAALRFSHAYDFRTTGGGDVLADGGRVEISYLDAAQGGWTDWRGVRPTDQALHVGNDTVEARGELLGPGGPVHRYGVQVTKDHSDPPEPEVPVPDPDDPEAPGPGDVPDADDPDPQASGTVGGYVHKDSEEHVDIEGNTPEALDLVPDDVPMEVIPKDQEVSATELYADAAGGTNESSRTDINERPPSHPPQLYQGPIASARTHAGESWAGFGGSSMGEVESVVDLSAYSGHLVRFRFVTSTGESFGTSDGRVLGSGGWMVERLEVLADAEEGVDVIGLVEPGQSVMVGSESDFEPVVALQNRGRTPRDAEVQVGVRDGEADHVETRLGIGPFGRTVVPAGASFHQLLDQQGTPVEDIYWLDVEVVSHHDVQGGRNGTASQVHEARSEKTADGSFYVHVNDVEDWKATGSTMNRIVTTSSGETEQSDNFYQIGQEGVVHATVQGTGSLPTPLNLSGPEADLRPRLVDLSGTEINTTFEPVSSSWVQDGRVVLPVSRSVAGSVGAHEGQVPVSWRWQGSSVAEVMRVQLVDGEGEVLEEVAEINVQTARPPLLLEEYTNDWQWDEDVCERKSESSGKTGVIVCEGEEEGMIRSPTAALDVLDLRRGNQTMMRLQYLGSANVTFQTNTSQQALSELPPPDAVWSDDVNITLPQADSSWGVNESMLAALPPDWAGWVRLQIDPGDAGFSLDQGSISLLQENVKADNDSPVPLVRADFDASVDYPSGVVAATTPAGLAVLGAEDDVLVHQHAEAIEEADIDDHCIDNPVNETVEDTPLQNQPIGDQPLICEKDAEDAVGSLTPTVDDGDRVLDTFLELEDPLDLGEVSRPVLEFRHWLDTGDSHMAIVEVARDPVEPWRTAEEDAALAGTSGGRPLTEEDWHPLATYRGATLGTSTSPARISLDDYVGEEIHLRFRYHFMDAHAHLSSDDVGGDDVGWLLDGVRVTANTAAGREPIRELENWEDDAISRGVTFSQDHEVEAAASSGWEPPGDGTPFWRFGDEDGGELVGASPSRAGDSIETDAVSIGSLSSPVLRIRHESEFTDVTCSSRPLLDVAYQTIRPDGTWPGTWLRVHEDPEDPRLPSTEGDGKPVGGAFDPDGHSCDSDDDFSYPISTDEFDLGTIDAGEIRFRFTAFLDPDSANNFAELEWRILSLEVGEQNHLVDASVDAVRIDIDDRERLQVKAPTRSDELGIDDEIVVANDQPLVSVDVTNQGMIPMDLEVSLVGESMDGDDRLDIGLVEQGSTGLIPQDTQTGRIRLGPDEQDTVFFFINDLDQYPPGAYRLTARVDSLSGADTDFRDNAVQAPLRVLPFRDLRVDLADSGVSPFAAGPGDARHVTVRIVNDGNVVEEEVSLEAEVVRMTGLNTFTSLGSNGVHLETLDVKDVKPRGDGRPVREWTFDPNDIPLGATLDPGEKYAVKIDVTPAKDSVTAWWNDSADPMPIKDDGTGLMNLTTPPNEGCGCLLMPFIVERVLYETDLTAANSTTEVDEVLDISSDQAIEDGWSTTTLVEGEPVDPATTTVPTWSLLNASAVAEQESDPVTGKAWHLPAYDGREEVVSILESPVLPAHIVRSDSRAILGLDHRSTVAEGQATIQTRQQVGGEWGDWEPIDTLRSERIAVVLAPDFPNVIPSGITDRDESMYDFATEDPEDDHVGIPGHPIPSLYDAYDNAKCSTQGGDFCSWGPYPAFPEEPDDQNWAWAEALNKTLINLTQDLDPGRLTDQGIALFSTLENETGVRNPDLGVGNFDNETGRWTYQVASDDRDYAFPIRSLDDLGLHLDSYGAIILVGDNTTTTFADQSRALQQLGHGPGDAAWDDPHPLAVEHHRKLFQILQTAPQAGVRAIATMGPAAGTLALSGAAEGVDLAVWQAFEHMPPRTWNAQIRCTYINIVTDEGVDHDFPEKDDDGNDEKEIQPKESCKEAYTSNGRREFQVDEGFNGNYYYKSPYDAQSHALLDLLDRGGAHHPTGSGTNLYGGFFFRECHDTPPDGHPLMKVVGGQVTCSKHPDVIVDGRGGVSFISMARPDDVDGWLDEVLTVLQSPDGLLPDGTGAWTGLEPRHMFPIGGEFKRLDNGDDYFDGSPMQIRIEVRSDPDVPGHGSFSVDRLSLLGTNRTKGLGIEWIEPVDGRSYAPGHPFQPVLEVTNRGVEEMSNQEITIDATDVTPEGSENSCNLPLPPAITLEVGTSLSAGEQIRVPLSKEQFNGGRFPRNPSCGIPLDEQENHVRFTAALEYAARNAKGVSVGDDDPRDDTATALAIGRQEVDVFEIASLRASPNEAPHNETATVHLEAILRNDNTQAQDFTVTFRVDPARPLPCRPDQDTGSQACTMDDTPATPYIQNLRITQTVPRFQEHAFSTQIDLDAAGMPPGVYLVTAKATTNVLTGDGVETLEASLVQEWIHLTDDSVEPEGGWAVDGTDLSGLGDLSPGQFSGSYDPAWHDSAGFYTTGVGTRSGEQAHHGLFGEDPRTQDDDGNDLRHGWQTVTLCDDCQDDPTAQVVEWRRDAPPSYPPGSPEKFVVPRGDVPPTADEAGMGDFGPDRLLWYPYDGRDKRLAPEDRNQYLSLASFERPSLDLLTRWDATDLTGLVVEMQVPQRVECEVTPPNPCTDTWNWNTPWFTLQPDERVSTTAGANERSSALTPTDEGCGGSTLVGGTASCRQRYQDSNPLAGTSGQWGTTSGRNAEDDGWERLTYPIFEQPGFTTQYCFETIAEDAHQTLKKERHPCRYAHVDQETDATDPSMYVARPVRFRFSAASYGGDVGESWWQLGQVALTEHRPAFVGPGTFPVELQDNSEQIIPLRIKNEGNVDDLFEVQWSPPGQDALEGADVDLSLTSDFSGAGDAVTFSLARGESRPVWARIETGILDRLVPGAHHPLPFLITAESVRDPYSGAEVLVDASMKGRAWPDLEVTRLVLDEDDSRQATFHAEERVEVTPIVMVANTGRLAVGGPDAPIHVGLVEEEYDCQDSTLIGRKDVRSTTLEETLEPLQRGGSEVPVPLDGWVPPHIGCFRLVGEVNRPDPALDGISAVPESSKGRDNALGRDVVVGPVRFPDLQVTDAWVAPITEGCQVHERIDHAVAGHLYCIVAQVENRGLEAAIGPRVEFSAGSSSAFSVEDFSEQFPGGVFPGIEDSDPVLVTASWPATLRADGSNEWTFFINVFSDVFSSSFTNKERQLNVVVDDLDAVVNHVPDQVVLPAGAETEARFNLTNKGNAPLSPTVVVDAVGEDIRFHVDRPSRLLPGESGTVKLQVAAARAAIPGDRDLVVHISSVEDEKLRIDVPLALVIEAAVPHQTSVYPLTTDPGASVLELVLDNSHLDQEATWSVASVEGPLQVPATAIGRTAPFEKNVTSVPVHVPAGTPPGVHGVNLTLAVETPSFVQHVSAQTTVEVLAFPRLDATMVQPQVRAEVDGRAVARAEVNNTGNVPVSFTATSVMDHGRVETTPGEGTLVPGASRTIDIVVEAGGTKRVDGTTTIAWDVPGDAGSAGSQEITWQVVHPVTRLRIVETDVGQIAVAPGAVAHAEVMIQNTGDVHVEAEALVLADGSVHGSVRIPVDPQETRTVSLPFRADPSGMASNITVAVRPLGSQLGPADPQFFEVGDAKTTQITPEDGPWNGVPAVPVGLVLALLACLALRRRVRP